MADKVKVSMNIPVDMKAYVDAEADKNGFTFTTMIQVIVSQYKRENEAIELTKNINLNELMEACRRNGFNVNMNDMPY